MIQHSKFDTGGFVLHKIPGDGLSTYSGWFDAKGNLLECEQTRSRHGQIIERGRAVPATNRHVRAAIEQIGARYVGK